MLALIIDPAVARADDPVTLAWSLKEGDTFYLKQTISREQTAEAGGRKQDTKSEVTTVIRFKVKAARDGETVMEMTYLDIRASAQGGRPQSIDPNSRFAGSSMTVTLDGKQTVTKLEGHAAFLDKLSGGDKAARKQLEAVLSESTVRQIVTVMFVPTPEKPVKVGDSWAKTDRIRLGELGEMTTNAKFTLEGVKDGAATVGVGGEATLKLGGGGGAGAFKVVKSDLTIETYKGRYVFDLRAGRPRESRTELLTTGTYTVESGGKETEIAIQQRQTTVIRISDRNPLDE
jgi:hypothetical protein